MLEPGSSIPPRPAWPGQRAATVDRHVARGEYIQRSSTSENYVRWHHRPRVASPRETGDTDIDDDDLMSKFTIPPQKADSTRRKWRASWLVRKDSSPYLSCPPSPTQTVDQTPSGTGRVAVQSSRRPAFSQLPSIMAAESQRPKWRDDTPSLNMDIDASKLGKETAGMTAFTSDCVLPARIRVGFLPVHVGVFPANVCSTRWPCVIILRWIHSPTSIIISTAISTISLLCVRCYSFSSVLICLLQSPPDIYLRYVSWKRERRSFRGISNVPMSEITRRP